MHFLSAVEDSHDIPLLREPLSRFCIPSVLLVSLIHADSPNRHAAYGVSLAPRSMRYSRMLEESTFANARADYLWLLTQSSVLLLAVSPLFTLPFLSAPLAFVPIYLWSRQHPATQISLFGLVTITAPYLPIALVAFSWIINGTWSAAAGDLVGCAVGHFGWFVRDVWVREAIGGSGFLVKAPEPL